MIDFKKYGIQYDPKTDYNITPNDLIAIGNIDRSIVETKVLEDNDTTIKIKGSYDIKNKDAIIGGEIIKVISSVIEEKNTILTVERAKHGTLQENWVGYNFRTVVLLDINNTEIDLIDWSFEDTIGSVSSNLFPVELGSGTVTMKSDTSLWSSQSTKQKFRVRVRKTVVYIFKGLNNKRFLKFTAVVSKWGANTRSKNDPNKIRLDIKTKLATWYDKDLVVNRQLKGTSPKEFFKMLFSLEDDEIYYAEGVSEDSFLKINNLHTKEYKKVSEILKAYCSNGVRFCFDKHERVKVFSDFKIDNILSQKSIYEDLTEATLTEDEAMIYNTISTQSVQRQTMFNFSDLQNKYVMYAKKLDSVISSDRLISIENNGDYVVNGLEIINADLHSASQIGDIVCFKRTIEPYYEYYAKVMDIGVGNKVNITPILFDKDFKLFYYGKGAYLYNILNKQVCQLDLYYVRQELPMVFKYTRNKSGEEKDSSLNYPILPRVNGETLYPVETNITFGSASNLKIGEYTGIIEEVEKIYGTWDSTKLLYNREIDQFSNDLYPPIFALTNKVSERMTSENTPMLNYTHFDNSNFLLEIKQPQDNKSDATLLLYNTSTVNKDIDLYVDTEISRLGHKIIQISDMSAYKIGDVLVVNRPEDLTPQEETEFDELLSTIRWTVVGKETQSKDGTDKHYLYLDSSFAKRQTTGKKYSFTRFPNSSIVYLQELYFRGNPVIEFKQDVTGISKGVNYDGDRSTDIYGEKKYEFDSKQLDKENMKKMMGYILDHFQAVDLNSTKFNIPITTYNGVDIELLDVITVLDPKYTQINDKSKWIVVSVNNKAKTNVVQVKLLNLNATNTVPFKLDVKDVLEYKPVEIPLYDHNGNEGTGGGENDGTGGDGVDESIGIFNMSEVDPQIFRGRVEKFEGNYIYFKDFAGSEWETYAGKLFPESEFGVSIDGETILVHSDLQYRAFVKKRDVYNIGEQVIITPESEVKFLIMSSFTDIDGQFYSRRAHLGDGDTYLKVHPITGVKIVGDLVVGENSQHAGNELWESTQKNKTFQQNDPPISDSKYTLKQGDMWYDLNDENHVYRYNGDVWISCRDGSIISTKSSTFIQPDEPTPTVGRPINDGDTWYDSDDGNKPYVYKNGVWVNVTDKNLQDAIDEAKNQIEGTLKLIEDMSADNKLTASEKQITKKEWEVIKGEYPLNVEKANAYSASTSNYTAKYNVLKTYIEPLIADLTTTSDIVGDTFRLNFKNYYDEEIKLTGVIYDKVKESAVSDSKDYADKIDQKVEKYASDGMLTPVEKADLKREIETIEATSTTLKARATTFGVSVTNLTTYVTKLTNWKTILSQVGNYEDTAKITELRADFKNYYTEEEKVYDGIDKKAKELADNAQGTADGALGKLDEIASDNKLSPSEKQQTKKEWDIILVEYPQNISKANAYGVVTTNYTTRYNALKQYIEPLISNLTTTSDVVGNTFRDNFKNYYNEEILLTGNIYDKVKESAVTDSKAYADKIDKKVEDYASDGVLTPAEKADLKSEIEMIESKADILKTRAGVFGVSVTTLTGFVTKLTGWKTMLSQAGNFTDKTQIIVLRTDFKNYYIEEEKVYDGIDKKAKELADNAQLDANGALSKLTEIASDNKLTEGEKQSTKKEWEVIKGEYPKVMDEASKFGVSTSDYRNYYLALETYLTPLLASMTTVSDIVGDLFRLNFKNYYTAKQDVFNRISMKITELNSMQNGKMLFLDPTFRNGMNDTKVYNNSGGGTVTITRMTATAFGVPAPNDSGQVLAITKIEGGVASPGCGGFYWGVQTKAGMKLLTKIVAYIPVGYEMTAHTNNAGTGFKQYFVTETQGTGAFKEYVHVMECGLTGDFQSTSFFAIKANDGNNTRAVTWGLSYATVFDSGGNQNEYVTTALGNAKIFHSPTAPISGMKTNDMWYDTDDGNHPHIYTGTIWVSARDKVYETVGGNKVYFQDAQPPTNGKEGDIWFKTNENNKMFILMSGIWTLADDALDKINTGRIVLNGNTTINGEFKVNGQNINLNGATTITGALNVYGGDRGIISYNGWDEPSSTERVIIMGGRLIFQQKV